MSVLSSSCWVPDLESPFSTQIFLRSESFRRVSPDTTRLRWIPSFVAWRSDQSHWWATIVEIVNVNMKMEPKWTLRTITCCSGWLLTWCASVSIPSSRQACSSSTSCLLTCLETDLSRGIPQSSRRGTGEAGQPICSGKSSTFSTFCELGKWGRGRHCS